MGLQGPQVVVSRHLSLPVPVANRGTAVQRRAAPLPPDHSPGAPAAGTGDPSRPAATHSGGLRRPPGACSGRYPAGTPQRAPRP